MSTNSNQSSLPANILVEFVLKINEAVVSCFIKSYPSEDSTNYIWPNL
uniref:Pco131239 n=1 Tax=Arundo donax TaxID=35708 RepID=A0A0A9IDZ1_ARUDO